MIKKLLEKLNIEYKNLTLYEEAMRHSSYSHEKDLMSNERLEFLGDAVIDILVSKYIFLLDEKDEGSMTKRRAHAVRQDSLVFYASQINLSDYILLGRGESIKGPNSAIIADAYEALFGAIYLDLGYEYTEKIFSILIEPHLKDAWKYNRDYKTLFQEYIQTDKRIIEYRTISENGPSHNKKFEIGVYVESVLYGVGIGLKKLDAEQEAAKEALSKMVGEDGVKKIIRRL